MLLRCASFPVDRWVPSFRMMIGMPWDDISISPVGNYLLLEVKFGYIKITRGKRKSVTEIQQAPIDRRSR
jgi:hypothetical protein